MALDLAGTLANVGGRLRALRQQRDLTLEQLAAIAGTSASTLSRLESGQRRPTLELLLPIAEAYRLPLDDLIGVPTTSDPRIHPRPIQREGSTWVPLHRAPGGLNAFKQILPVTADPGARLDQRTHEGFEWIYVLSGQIRLALADDLFTIDAGEAAEFDTRTPHAVVNTSAQPTELIIIFGQQGQRIHMRGADPTTA